MSPVVDFMHSLLIGMQINQIKVLLGNFEEMYLGLFINKLVYKTEKEGKIIKKQFYQQTSVSLKKINDEIKKCNEFISACVISFPKIKKVNLSVIQKIIISHKGDYPKTGKFIDEILGHGDSPSVLSRRYTALLLHNALQPTRLSVYDFSKAVKDIFSPFQMIDHRKIKKSTLSEIERIKSVYSIGGFAEAIFMIGRLTESIVTTFLLLLKKNKKIELPCKTIKSDKYTFENKIDYLHSKNILTQSQFAKMKSVKWDRNLYGHTVRTKPKDATAMITIGLQSIQLIEQKYKKIRK